MPDHEALLLDRRNGGMRVASTPSVEPGDRQIAVRTRAVAVNPVDRSMPALARLITSRLRCPAALGSDVAGEVVAVGAALRHCRARQRALGLALGTDKGRGAAEGAIPLLPQVLAERRDVAAPAPLVAGRGPDAIPAAFAVLAKGVSPRKIAVSL